VVVNYEMHQNLLTSFTGKDLLYTRLNSGNAKSSSLGGKPQHHGDPALLIPLSDRWRLQRSARTPRPPQPGAVGDPPMVLRG
jgi:hypothetical protein